ncbi:MULTISPECIES: 2OG-Fe(II) oxygenase [Pseudomonas]|uniref:2OG-Fe(II) oxygenase n=1 Tax=Pseudomonas TaxID=286 RepID=UPI001CE409D8|nr:MULTISPECIES: 2OG-Fe(II) oxygenase [Pseudomonas]MCO7593087.1 2OG-Fe(II) oxygenase [Pseudomonas guariconensis]MCO7631830.1 2OG-Fe(II) oxygenase [Pseudomonas guariconensis]MCU7221259.1 2OG-Fe(II) oxygenase [Pseudomonas brassicacearum]
MKRQFTSEDVKIIDNAITPTEQAQLDHAFSDALWRYDWPVNSTPFARPCWHFFIAGSKREALECCEKELAINERWGFLINIWKRLCAVYMKNSRLLGVYANGQTFGQDSPIHRDNLPSEPGHTAVLFCNDYWATTWGGELLFCNDAKTDIITAALPKPRRIAIFNGEMPHRAKSPAIDCDRLRTTIAFKTINKDHIP